MYSLVSPCTARSMEVVAHVAAIICARPLRDARTRSRCVEVPAFRHPPNAVWKSVSPSTEMHKNTPRLLNHAFTVVCTDFAR
jgi:hypothetical protein